MTSSQRKVYDFIVRYIDEHGGISPTYDEIAEGVGLKSKGTTHALVHRLAARGYITFTRGARSIQIVHTAKDMRRVRAQRDLLHEACLVAVDDTELYRRKTGAQTVLRAALAEYEEIGA